MDFIYSRLNNGLVDINRIESITLLKCEVKDEPVEGLEVGDYYLKVTVVDSDKVSYCDLSDLTTDQQVLLDKIYQEEQRAINREKEIENIAGNKLDVSYDESTSIITLKLLNIHDKVLNSVNNRIVTSTPWSFGEYDTANASSTTIDFNLSYDAVHGAQIKAIAGWKRVDDTVKIHISFQNYGYYECTAGFFVKLPIPANIISTMNIVRSIDGYQVMYASAMNTHYYTAEDVDWASDNVSGIKYAKPTSGNAAVVVYEDSPLIGYVIRPSDPDEASTMVMIRIDGPLDSNEFGQLNFEIPLANQELQGSWTEEE